MTNNDRIDFITPWETKSLTREEFKKRFFDDLQSSMNFYQSKVDKLFMLELLKEFVEEYEKR